MESSEARDLRVRFAGFEGIPLEVTVRVGSTRCRLSSLLALEAGQILRLDRAVGAPFEVVSGGRVLALAEPVADEESVALRIVALAEDDDDVGS